MVLSSTINHTPFLLCNSLFICSPPSSILLLSTSRVLLMYRLSKSLSTSSLISSLLFSSTISLIDTAILQISRSFPSFCLYALHVPNAVFMSLRPICPRPFYEPAITLSLLAFQLSYLECIIATSFFILTLPVLHQSDNYFYEAFWLACRRYGTLFRSLPYIVYGVKVYPVYSLSRS